MSAMNICVIYNFIFVFYNFIIPFLLGNYIRNYDPDVILRKR